LEPRQEDGEQKTSRTRRETPTAKETRNQQYFDPFNSAKYALLIVKQG
jgi:hypothetical protein